MVYMISVNKWIEAVQGLDQSSPLGLSSRRTTLIVSTVGHLDPLKEAYESLADARDQITMLQLPTPTSLRGSTRRNINVIRVELSLQHPSHSGDK